MGQSGNEENTNAKRQQEGEMDFDIRSARMKNWRADFEYSFTCYRKCIPVKYGSQLGTRCEKF